MDWGTFSGWGCAAGRSSANGLVILDFGRPAYRSSDRRFGTIDFAGHFDGNPDILRAMEGFAAGYHACLPWGSGVHINLARGTNNSCSNQDPRCCPQERCKSQPPSFWAAGNNWAAWTEALERYLVGRGWSANESASAADDAEPAWDPEYSNTADFLAAFAAKVGYAYTMWDYGSLEPGYWSPSQEYQIAYGFHPDVPVPEIYGPGSAREWEDLELWAVANRGRPMKIAGVVSQYAGGDGCGYQPHQAYDAMLAQLQSNPSTYQYSIPYLTDIECPGETFGA